MLDKIPTKKYLYLRDRNKINFPKETEIEAKRLSNILCHSMYQLHKNNLSKKTFDILYKPTIAIITEFYIGSEKIDIKDNLLSINKIIIPSNIYNLNLLQTDKSFSLLNSIKYLKHKFSFNENIKLDEILIYKKEKTFFIKDFLKKNILIFLNIFFSMHKQKIYLDIFNFKLYLKFFLNGRSPQFFTIKNQNNIINNYDYEYRSKIFNIGNKFNKTIEQKKFWYTLVFQLPLSLVENFQNLINIKFKSSPSINKFVLSNIRKNEIENLFIGRNLQNSFCKLEIFQYGMGPFFQNKHNFTTQYELDIADKFFSWTKVKNKKICQIPLFKKININKSTKSINKIILINSSFSYFYKFGNGPMFEGITKYFNNQIEFLNIIKEKFTNILIKNPNYENENFDKIKFYKDNSLDKFLTNKKIDKFNYGTLPVCSYLGTSFLELMANDIPNILFFRPGEFNLTPRVKYYFKKMKKYNFIHYNPKNAARFITDNRQDLIRLWNNKSFFNLRESFRSEFCKRPDNWQNVFVKLVLK